MEPINWYEFLLPYEQAVDELCGKFKAMDKEYRAKTRHSPVEHVLGRVKRVGSILEKARRKEIPLEKVTEQITDIAGVRVICQFVEDIEKVAQTVRDHENFDLHVVDEQDYVSVPKPSGYRSYHMRVSYSIFTVAGPRSVPVEIQIRTLSMDFWATIEHSLKYKYNGKIPDALRARLIRAAEVAFQLDREMSTIRDEIMESQKVIRVRNDLVDQMLKKIQELYLLVSPELAQQLNEEFFKIYGENNPGRLAAFHNKLDAAARLYTI